MLTSFFHSCNLKKAFYPTPVTVVYDWYCCGSWRLVSMEESCVQWFRLVIDVEQSINKKNKIHMLTYKINYCSLWEALYATPGTLIFRRHYCLAPGSLYH